jgi:hypothetical protein
MSDIDMLKREACDVIVNGRVMFNAVATPLRHERLGIRWRSSESTEGQVVADFQESLCRSSTTIPDSVVVRVPRDEFRHTFFNRRARPKTDRLFEITHIRGCGLHVTGLHRQ